MSDIILERTIKSFVKAGAGFSDDKVVSGRETTDAPDGLYASVTLMNEMPIGMPTHQQFIGNTNSYTIDSQMLMSSFDIQFYRDGALAYANLFANWARSESGTTWAATSLTCGRLAGVNVYASGSGYTNGSSCTFEHDADDAAGSNIATGVIQTDILGGIKFITLSTGGSGYSLMPTSISIVGGGTGASVSPRGYGFSVERIKVRNLTQTISGEFEERAQIDLDIFYKRIYNDTSSGRVERIIGERDNIIFDSDDN